MRDEDQQGLWQECLWLGRCLLPLMDAEAWRRDSRWEEFRGMGVERGEGLFGVLAGIVIHAALKDAVAAGSSPSGETLDAIPLRVVAQAALSDRPDYAFLVGAPSVFADETEETAVLAIRLCVYARSPQLAVLKRYLVHTLQTVTGRSAAPEPTCGSLRAWAREAGMR